jgi:hypothetical protein
VTRPGLLVVLAAILPGLAVVAAAQGLGDVAARERQQRQKKAAEKEGEAPTFSNDDLKGLSGVSNESSTGTVSAPGTATVSPSSGGTPSRRPRARAVPRQDRVRTARAQVEALEARLEVLQQRLNPMSTTYIYGSTGGPVGGSQADEELRIRSQISATEQQLAQARQALSAAEGGVGSGGPAPEAPSAEEAMEPPPDEPADDEPGRQH